jgi:glycosyltransferase involved in cell wall biosynthesis
VRTLALAREAVRHGWRAALFTVAAPDEAAAGVPAALAELCDPVVVQPLARSRARSVRLALDVLGGRPLHRRYFVARGGPERAAELAASLEPEVVVAETLYALPYVPVSLLGRTVLDTQNAEAWRLRAMTRAGGLPRRLAARLQIGPVERHEREQVRRVARTLAVSESEAAVFEPFAPGRVDLVPNGVDCAGIRPRAVQPAEPVVLFLGSLDYAANVDALAVLVDEILPQLATAGARLLVVGSNPRREVASVLARSALPYELAANVASVEPFAARARVLAVPLRLGGGTRLKILEALARGLPVVSSRIGCDGLGLRPGVDLLVEDSPAAFAAALDRLLTDDGLCGRLAAAGRTVVEQRYDWRAIGAAFAASLTRAAGRA